MSQATSERIPTDLFDERAEQIHIGDVILVDFDDDETHLYECINDERHGTAFKSYGDLINPDFRLPEEIGYVCHGLIVGLVGESEEAITKRFCAKCLLGPQSWMDG